MGILIVFIIVAIPLGLYMNQESNKSKDFSDSIEVALKKHGLHYVNSTYPGLFKVGPFKKFEITIGKPMINDGAIQYDHTYYRIVELKTKDQQTKKVWAKIETNWFKDTKIEFNPSLSEIKKEGTDKKSFINPREYILLSIDHRHDNQNARLRLCIDVTAKQTIDEQIVTLKKISLPAYVEIGDVIRWCEHQFYDVIDTNGDLMSRQINNSQ